VHLSDIIIVVRGGGAVGTGVAYRLFRAGFTVIVTELGQPRAVRRGAAFAEAVYAGAATVEGVTARLAEDPMAGMAFSVLEEIPIATDDAGEVVGRMQPRIVVDARMAERNLDTRRRDAPLVLGVGAGFIAGKDCHAVVDSTRGHNLGRVYWDGAVDPSPDDLELAVVWATASGVMRGTRDIGQAVRAGDVLAEVDGAPCAAAVDGVLAGLLHDGVTVSAGERVGDIEPSGDAELCWLIPARARAIGGGVLEAILAAMPQWRLEPPAERDLL
jgi:xanthine dehydrogenase accessory factor